MFGTKIKSWMEAHIARSRAKKKERAAGKVPVQAATRAPVSAQARPPLWNNADAEEACTRDYFDPKFFLAAADHDHFNEVLPISSSTFRGRNVQQQQQQQQQPQQQQGQYKTSAVNLSSPESAYSTGYSTDGTSPCATYAPECYVKVRPAANAAAAAPLTQPRTTTTTTTTTTTEENRWRKPTPPKSTRPAVASPAKSGQGVSCKPYSTPLLGDSYPLQLLFSPRRMPPLLATTSTQVTPVKTSRCSRPRPHRPTRTYLPSNLHRMQDLCCRQESLSVGRSPLNRAKQRLGSSSSSSSVCSISSTSSSSERNAAAPSSTSSSLGSSRSSNSSDDDLTLNELMGKYDENYLCDADNANGYSSSANFSSEASANSSLERARPSGSRLQQQQQPRRRRGSRLMQRSRSQLENAELSAQTNRALLERLLMNKSSSRRCQVKPTWTAPASASRSLGGTPICLRRRKQLPQASMLAPAATASQTSRRRAQPALLASTKKESCASSLNNVSASELALLEADREADLKYAQLIMEAERMLINVQQQLQRDESAGNSRRGSNASVATADGSPSRFPRRPYIHQAYQPQQTGTRTASAPNKRVELIKNAELNIELALLKSRNSQPELSSGSIKDLLDHSSPKRLLQQQQKKTIEPAMAAQTIVSTLRTGTNPFPAFQPIDAHLVTSVPTPPSEDKELSAVSEHYACPQSEPVKRKVYEDQQESSRLLQHQAPPWLRNSDGDCTAADLQSQHQPMQSASASSSYSQLRKHMLIETLQGLKQSLEDQSASLKLNCLRPI